MRTNRLIAVVASCVAVAVAACNNEGITDLNKNPNSPTDVPAGPLFTEGARLTAARWLGAGYDLRQTEFVIQHEAEVQYPDEDIYKRLDAASTAQDAAYYTELEDLTKVIAKGKAANEAGTWAPAEVLRALGFLYITNTYGPVPYSQALQGDSVGGALNPTYDTQQAIYADLFARLDAASTALASASNTLGSADPIYGGDPAAWAKFANSIRARMAITLSDADPATANTQLAAALAAPGGIILDNADNATFKWPGDGVYDNPWSGNFQGRDDNRVSRTLITELANTSDPRVSVYAQVPDRDTVPDPAYVTKYCTGGSCYVGLQNGLTQATAGPWVPYTSRPSILFYPAVTSYGLFPGATGKSFPSFLFTAAEGNFILAEAYARGIGVTQSDAAAATYYNAGITQSMNQWGVTNAATIAAYLANPNVAYVPGNTGLIRIADQKWIALYSDGGTAWTEWRRTCQPSAIQPGPNAIINQVPERFMYSPKEYTVNGVNVTAAVSVLGGPDALTTPLYFAANRASAPTAQGGAACH